jgi:hypothetical protein
MIYQIKDLQAIIRCNLFSKNLQKQDRYII